MILIPALPLALVFITAVLFAAVCIAIGWACHMLYNAENQPTATKPTRAPARLYVAARYVPDDTPPMAYPGWRRDREAARASFRCPSRLPAAPAVDMAAAVVEAERSSRPRPMPGWEVREDNRRRFRRDPEQLRKDADAIAAKKEARTARVQAQVINSIPNLATAVAR